MQENGVLILGNSESINAENHLFSTLDSKMRIYQYVVLPSRTIEMLDFPNSFVNHRLSETTKKTVMIPDNIQALTEKLLLQKFTPAGILVNSQGDILYFVGSTGKYLEPDGGKANMNVYSMAREGLRNILPTALRKASKNYDKVVYQNIKLDVDSEASLASLTIQQIDKPLALKGKILIIFTDEKAPEKNKPKKDSQDTFNNASELEYELNKVRGELEQTIEEMQISREEQTSMNEELQSTNEELQSTNEELTTSKEEMQSLNEELHSLNAEMQGKIDDSVRTSNDMNNLLNSSEIATLFLDKALRIRHFTPAATNIYKLKTSDVGRLFTDQATDLQYPQMYEDAKEVLHTLKFLEKSIKASDDRWFQVRIMPYRTIDDRIDGLVITFLNITTTKNLEIALAETRNSMDALITQDAGILIEVSKDWMVKEINAAALQCFDQKRGNVIGKDFFELFIDKAERIKVKTKIQQLIKSSESSITLNHTSTTEVKKLNIEWKLYTLYNKSGKVSGILLKSGYTSLM
jgi:two-component system CheB/CheR fusion protein